MVKLDIGNFPFVKDIFDDLQQIHTILNPNSTRKLSEIQCSIIIQKRIVSLKQYLNDLNRSNIKIEDQAEIYQQTLDKIRQILTYKPREDPAFYWYELEMFRCSLAGSLMAAWGKGGFLRTVGSANALSEILLGIELVDFFPILVEDDHPEYIKRSNLAFNYTNMSAGLFYIASTSLYRLSKHYLEKWGTIAVQGNEHLLELLEKVTNVKIYLEYDRKYGTNRFFTLIIAIISVINQMIRYLLFLFARFGGNCPDSIKKVKFLDTKNFDTFLDSLVKLYQKIDTDLNVFSDLSSNYQFGSNEKLLDNPGVQLALERTELTELTLKGLRIINDFLKDALKIKEKWEKFNDEILSFLREKDSQLNNMNFLTTSLGELYAEYLEYFSLFIGLYTIEFGKLSYLEKYQETLGAFVNEKGKERFPKMYHVLLTAKISCAVKNKNKGKLLTFAKELIKLSDAFTFQPRDTFACLLLGNLIKLLLKKIKIKTFNEIISEQLHKIEEALCPTMIKEIKQYLENLNQAFEGKEANYDLGRLKQVNPLEMLILLNPDLNLLDFNSDFGNIKYLPFNLATDYVC
ncbi:MAG: hypothetical protein GF308_07185 [Candidatus Heimdallarchaeota archaeon]|nr:hypothetical protein [Candidatus Heimdallarchaeota archaeon]